MAEAAGSEEPVVEQPAAVNRDQQSGQAVEEGKGEVAASSGWGSWGMGGLTNLLSQPHLLEQGLNNVASQVAQGTKAVASKSLKATTGASKMVKSKSMEVMKAVQEDLGEVKSTLSTYAAPVKGAGGVIKNSIQELDEVTDEMAEAAINGVAKGASSLWNMASGYASQMFTEEDLEATPVLVGSNSEPIILDRLQAQLHALASDPTTYTKDPDPQDALAEDWTSYLATVELDSRQGEISELMINNGHVRKHYSNLVPSSVPHKLFWARYFFKVHLIDQQEVKRQALRRRAEEAKVDSDSEINWDEDEDLGDTEIPEAVQEKLLSDYEAEIKKDSPKKPSHAKKDSNASDDWEKLSDDASSK